MKQEFKGNITNSALSNVNTSNINSGINAHHERINKFALALSVISIILSGASIYCVRCNLAVDMTGVIVGALSATTALLIGWNIFYALGIKDETKEINNKMQMEIKRLEKIRREDAGRIANLENLLLSVSKTPIQDALDHLTKTKNVIKNRRRDN